MNFSRNTRCLKCKAEGPKRVAMDDVQMKKGDWNCPGSWISTCKWHNMSPLHLLSSSYDGKVMLWDLRTAEKPTTLDCSPRTICRRHIMTSSYLYECLWEALQ
ncbi:Ribosome biogenesis WDR12 [Gossypium arboreum]|uniref:Ribosome biogenesis WDR12 n=1 Tax=Gossypium arboreum TaxID=29729 RepID=A0A0B0NUK3_GOSAR|nr:Ribosome biogenesis WDR12 [Gossypium arboreum]